MTSVRIGTTAYFYDSENVTATFVSGEWEALSIHSVSGDGTWHSPHWTVSMYASEMKSTIVTFANSSAEDITVNMAISPASHDEGNLTMGVDQSSFIIPAKGKFSVTFQVQTTQSVTPGTYSTIVTINR